MRIPLSEARPGDILVFKGDGFLYEGFSRLIKWLKEPAWDRWGWHLAPIIKVQTHPYLQVTYINAQFPRLKLNTLKPDDEIRCYRVLAQPPSNEAIQVVIDRLIGRPYDCLVYFWSFLSFFLRPRFDFLVPRIINRFYDCWEATFEALDEWGVDITWVWNYPWLTDMLKFVGEIE